MESEKYSRERAWVVDESLNKGKDETRTVSVGNKNSSDTFHDCRYTDMVVRCTTEAYNYHSINLQLKS